MPQDEDDSNGEKKSNKCNYQEHNKDDDIISTEEEELNLKHQETIYHVSNEEENTRQHVASNEHIITEGKTESNNKNRTRDEIFKSSFETVNSSVATNDTSRNNLAVVIEDYNDEGNCNILVEQSNHNPKSNKADVNVKYHSDVYANGEIVGDMESQRVIVRDCW